MKSLLAELMQEATRLTRAGRLKEATQAILRALRGGPGDSGGGNMPPPAAQPPPSRALNAPRPAAFDPLVLDGCVVEQEAPATSAAPVSPRGTGEFVAGTHSHAALTRSYKLYVPPGAAGRRLPLVVMLHGCTQDPDDFAAGTAMNEHAHETGFYVLYPAQSGSANAQRCWNWFKPNHQRRGSGEPALIADLVAALQRAHGIDARRVYVAGLSAGGAMAAIVAAAYPDVFAAAGVHSGLAPGAAGNVSEALAAMRSGAAASPGGAARRAAASAAAPMRPVPTIVFHGDMDATVHPRNGEQLIAALHAGGDSASRGAAAAQVEQGISARGRRYTRCVHGGMHEHWLVHGAGHAWSGGQTSGSYTDAQGPDATLEMLRFFFQHTLA